MSIWADIIVAALVVEGLVLLVLVIARLVANLKRSRP